MNASTLGALGLLLGAALGVAGTQPKLATVAHTVREKQDVYALLPPAQLRAATLGWEAAAVDMLWAKLLVDYGTHWSEHRDFLDTPKYLDAILALEPTYAQLYKFVDTLLAYRPLLGTEADARLARAYYERGIRDLPNDPAVWTAYGDFLAYIGPSFLHDDAEREVWRQDGARAIAKAAELGLDADSAMAAATLLARAGSKQEAIRHLELAYAFTEDPSMAEAHEKIGEKLALLQASAMADEADAIVRAIDERWRKELPSLSRDQYLLLGPVVDVARCAGLAHADDPACARDWNRAIPTGDTP